ncbi:MAG TPA: aldo/keto reductase [Kiritimatiellia bacterium]|nr:aldo/keto reductase [Kiritimatiellia bacterium]HSA17411.1 aldo/keto reductase [Kiritimatiellia bacterium]
MEMTGLGTTGLRVSRLAMGTMTFGKEADRATSAALFHRAREAGINLFDCADIYALGESEKILGELIRGVRDQVVITSKVYFAMEPGLKRAGLSREHILRSAEGSLKRLKTDRLDIYFAHAHDDLVPIEETLGALDELVRQGKALHTGASNFAAWQVARALGISDVNRWTRFSCIQPMYNLVKRQAEVELFPMARAEKLGVLVYSPLGGGLLTGKYRTGEHFKDSRLVHSDLYRRRYGPAWMHDAAREFTALARSRGFHPAALAVAWAAAHPAVTAPILGARNLEQLEPALQAADIPMTPELYQAVSRLTPAPPPATDRSESAAG